MGSSSEDDEQYRFFDACDDIASVPSCSKSSDSCHGVDNCVSSSSEFDVWIRSPRSVEERRSKFLNWMGMDLDWFVSKSSIKVCSDAIKEKINRIRRNSEVLQKVLSLGDEFSSGRSSMSCCSNDASDLLEEFVSTRTGNSDGVVDCSFEDSEQDDGQAKLRVAGSPQLVMSEKFKNGSESSPSAQQLPQKEPEAAKISVGMMKRINRWLSKLGCMKSTVDRQGKAKNLSRSASAPIRGIKVQRVAVRHRLKQSKELSALFLGQDIQAHGGPILTMKFSFDGQYLASADEAGIVRVWQVVEDERSNEVDVPELDPSCVYFTVNHLSELAPLSVDKDKVCVLKSLRKTVDSACVIFPPKVFRILEKMLHEFNGHSGEILDLSWSKNNYLLSASVDKSVRLWRVGCDHCLKVFSHSNYVTSVQFNPVDDNHFISGSIDGIVRIWVITGCQVIDWTDTRDIVTAVCYRPDGQGGIVGSITGNCRFYNISDNQLQLESQICLRNKKKSPFKRITGFQFYPQDPSKLLVTCADSKVRILHGINVIGKYKGLRNAGNQIFASFTSDGKHIISTNEDSNVYIWSCSGEKESSLTQPRKVKSCEHFSTNAAIAIPWSGFKFENSVNGGSPSTWPLSSPTCFSLRQQFILECFTKGPATWPEEKLPSKRVMQQAIRKSQYKFLKNSCQSTSSSHAWGLVIVTGGWDGRIRSFYNYGLPVPV